MAESPPTSPRSSSPIISGHLNPSASQLAIPRSSRSRRLSNGSQSIRGSISGRERSESPARFDGPSSSLGREPYEPYSHKSPLSSEKRQDSRNWNASTMSLLDFRERNIKFHWENTDKTHKTFPDSDPWPLPQKGRLGKPGGKRKAIVYAAEITRENHGFADMVALKIVRYSTDREKYHADIEIKNLQKLCHNHIVAFVGSYIKGKHIGILMFPVAAWDLEQFLESENVGGRLDMMRPWFSCLARALIFLHKRFRPFKHRDIKPANILIDCSGSVYLTDFGIAKEYASDAAMVTRGDGRYTVKYASPQTVEQVDQGVESDIFSLGCVFLEMATVILKTELEKMFTYLGSHTGKVWYYQVVGETKGWAEELKDSVKMISDSSKHEKHLASHGLEMITSMIIKSASGNAPDLEEVCKCFEPLKSDECKSCSKQISCAPWQEEVADFEPISELPKSSDPSNTVAGPSSAASPLIAAHIGGVTNPDQVEHLHQDMQDSPPILITRATFSDPDNQNESQILVSGKGNPVRFYRSTNIAAIFQRKHTEASHNPVQHSANPNEMITDSHSQITFQDIAPPAPVHNQDAALPAGAQEPTCSNSKVVEPTAKPVMRQQTEPFSFTSINSEIRIADNSRKTDAVRVLKDVADIPGKEILWFDPEPRPSGRWRSSPKEEVARQNSLREGVLWVLPRGFGLKYRTSQGFFYPWKELSFRKNMKRIFGPSMRTMFLKGRYTQEQLENAMGRKANNGNNMD